MDDLDQINRLQAKAVFDGAHRRSVTSTHWDVSANCEKPVTIERHGRVSAKIGELTVTPLTDGASKTVAIEARCRKCSACLKMKQVSWAYRATQECDWSTRTWFCTFTLTPQMQYHYDLLTIRKLADSCVSDVSLSSEELFIEKHRQISKYFTKMFKRLRKNTGVQFRYLLVVEKHKSGEPHYHALIHEFLGELSKRNIQMEWALGFSNVKLVHDHDSARYVCKYLSKDSNARVRASRFYGKTFHLDEARKARITSETTDTPSSEAIGFGFSEKRVSQTRHEGGS